MSSGTDRPRLGTERGRAWPMVGAGAALVGSCYGLARFAYGLFAPELAREFAIGPTLSGVIGSGSYLGYCVAIVVSLVLTPRWGARSVAVMAGAVATVGLTVVAAAPSAAVLAIGVLIAGSSTGIASPPMAAAVGAWVRRDARDRAQTVVNAGTGLGVLVSGPVALLLLEQWRWAWAAFAVVAAAVTCWVHLAVPAGAAEATPRRDASAATRPAADPDVASSSAGALRPGVGRLVGASLLMGVGSIAVWTFGSDLITHQAGASATISPVAWTVLGASGILGAVGGDLTARLGLPMSWSALMVAMAVATALLAVAPAAVPTVLAAAALFGASYIALTGVVLIWSTHVYPDRTSFGVGLSFLAIAAGQAVGAPVVGRLIEAADATTAFYGSAALAALAAALRPPADHRCREGYAHASPSRSRT